MDKKWVKLLKEFQGKPAGEVVQLDAAKADTLVELSHAEAHEDPTAGIVEQAVGALDERIKQAAELAADAAFQKVTASLKGGNGSRRPHIQTHDNEQDDPKCGFKYFGEFAGAVRKHAVNRQTDDRLVKIEKAVEGVMVKAPTNYAAEAVGADGGYLVPTEFSNQLLRHMLGNESLLPRTRQIRTNGNSITIPKDETTPWGSDGVQVYWVAEGAQGADSKPKIGEIELKLHKLMAIVPVTNELLEDSGAISLDSYLNETTPERITEKVNGALINGKGAGQPLGVLNSPALKEVAKEAGQTADTVNTTNVLKMYAALPQSSKKSFVWLHHSTVLPQFGGLTIGTQPMFIPPGGIAAAPGGNLLGAALHQSEDCQVLGDKGDLYAIDFRNYVTVTKTTGIQTAMSLHLYFDRDMTAFRFVFRVAGQPWMKQAITQKNGGGTLSPFLVLAERA